VMASAAPRLAWDLARVSREATLSLLCALHESLSLLPPIVLPLPRSSVTPALGHTADFFGVKSPLDITWGHAINSRAALNKALSEYIHRHMFLGSLPSYEGAPPI
jgi:hypothetical protein